MIKYDYKKPIPDGLPRGGRKKGGRNDVLRKMPVNASFFFPGIRLQLIATTWRKLQKEERLASKFTSRTVTENGVKGVRVWRIE